MLEVLLPFLYMKQTNLPGDNETADQVKDPPQDEIKDDVSRHSFLSKVSGSTSKSNNHVFDLACVYAFFKRFVR